MIFYFLSRSKDCVIRLEGMRVRERLRQNQTRPVTASSTNSEATQSDRELGEELFGITATT